MSTVTVGDVEQRPIGMVSYLEALFSLWQRFLLLLVALPLLVSGSTAFVFPSYHASAKLWIESPTYFGGLSPTGWDQYLSPAQNEADSLSQLLSTNSFMNEIGDDLVSNHVIEAKAHDDAVRALSGKLTATADGSHLVSLAVVCYQKAICVGALEATIRLQDQWLAASEQSQAKVATAFYSDQVKQATDRLAADQAALTKYLDQHPGLAAEAAAVGTMGSPQLANLGQQVKDDQDSLQGLQNKLASVQLASAATGEISSTLLKVIDQPRLGPAGLLSSLDRKTAAIAAAICIVPGLVYLAFVGWSDRTARDPREIEERLGVRLVARIPTLVGGPTR